ncbi:hypothetical protein EON67_10010 [archaeon]|nr:MAG: hypothetical protein EON67_10010 [archaeon]
MQDVRVTPYTGTRAGVQRNPGHPLHGGGTRHLASAAPLARAHFATGTWRVSVQQRSDHAHRRMVTRCAHALNDEPALAGVGGTAGGTAHSVPIAVSVRPATCELASLCCMCVAPC